MGRNFNLTDPKGKTIARNVITGYKTKNEGQTYGVVRHNGKDCVVRYNEKTGDSYIGEEAKY